MRARKVVGIVVVTVIVCLAAGVLGAKEKRKVLARVNRKILTLKEFGYILSPYGRRSLEQWPEKTKQRRLDQWIKMELVYQEALKQKLHRDKLVQERIRQMERQIITRAFLEREMEKGKKEPTEEELKKYYEEHPEKYTTPERVKLAIIEVATEEEAEAVRKRLVAGEDFATVAGELSTDKATKNRGGYLVNPTRTYLARYGAEVAKTAFELESGKVSSPVKGRRGYYVLKSSGKIPAVQQSFASAKPRIQRAVMNENQTERYENIVKALRTKAKIETHPELLAPPEGEGKSGTAPGQPTDHEHTHGPGS